MQQEHEVVIIGAGFGGLHAAKALSRAPVRVTLIDRRNFHCFQPLLYQVATGALSPANISMPIRAILKRQKNAEMLLGEVIDFDLGAKRVLLRDGAVGFDSLIVGAGTRHYYFGHDDWEPLAPGLKTIEEATEIRRRILLAFESAEVQTDCEARREWMRFTIVGAGPTGVEMAGAIAELARHTLQSNFRRINPASAEILLLEAADRVLSTYPLKLSRKAEQVLNRLGVSVRTSTVVESIGERGVTVRRVDSRERIVSRTVVWAAGVRASDLGRKLAQISGAEADRGGRVVVEPDLSISNYPDVFVIGDLAHCRDQQGQPLPGVAPVAIQQGKYAARAIRARLKGKTLPPFRYRDHGQMATIGRAAAVAQIGPLQFNGLVAWLAWLFVHLMNLVGFQNRLLVFIQWAWNYFTRNRSARLITETQLTERPTRVAGVPRAKR